MVSDAGRGQELASVLTQADLIQYQAGAVVSRTLMKKPSGTVTAFAFDAGEGLSEHSSPFDALVLMMDGEAEIEISGIRYTVRAGELIKLPADEPHAVKALKRFKMILVMLKA